MPVWTYMLHCAGGAFHVGHTDDLERRMAQHHAGTFPGYTSTRQPVNLVWSDSFPECVQALDMERRLKGWSRAKKLALIRGDWAAISVVAKGKGRPSTGSGRTEV